MSTLHVYSNRHIKDQVANIKKGDCVYLENSLSKNRWSLYFKHSNINEIGLDITYVTPNEKYNKFLFLENGETMEKQFDIVTINPPYQDPRNPTTKLWNRFVELGFKHLKDGGKICSVTPSVWMKRPNGQACSRLVENIMSNYQLESADCTATTFFDVGEEICSYIIEKTPTYKDTKFTFYDRTEEFKYTGQKLCLTKEDETALEIFNKIVNYKGDKLYGNVWCDYGSNSSIDERIVNNEFSLTKTGKFTQPVFWTASNTDQYYADPSKSKKGIKLIINRSGYYYVKDNIDKYIKLDTTDKFAVGVAGYALSFTSKKEAENCRTFLTSKLYAWFVEFEKSGGFNTGVPKLGLLDYSKAWTNSEVYAHYNLTDKEIEYVEARIK